MLKLAQQKKTKFAILTQHWLATKGGITTVTRHLAEALKKRDFAVTIITPDYYRAENVINVRGRRFKLILFIWTFFALLKLKPDLIQCQEHGYMFLAASLYKCLFRQTKIFFSFHTAPEEANGWMSGWLFRWSLNRCSAVTGVSQALIRSIEKKKRLRLQNAQIIPAGVQARIVSEDEKQLFIKKYQLAESFPILCTVGVLNKDWKVAGIEFLLKALKQLNLPKAKLVIVGDGTYKDYLKNAVSQLSLEDKVIFTGNLENVFLPLSICDIYCHLALKESFGIAILEAMALGKPVLAARRGGIPEIITDRENGLLVEPQTEQVQKAIEELCADEKLRQSLGKNARNEVRAKYNWRNVAERYAKLYAGEKEKIRVLHLGVSGIYGGVEILLSSFLAKIKNYSRLEHAVCFLMQKGPVGTEIEKMGISVDALNMKSGFDLKRALKLIRIVKEGRFQVVHCHHVYQPLAWIILFLIRPRATVLSEHGQSIVVERGRKVIEQYLHIFLRGFISRYTAVGEFMKESMVKKYRLAPEKVEVIYNGVDSSRFNPALYHPDAERARLSLPFNTPIVGAIGRLIPEKGLDHFILAASEIIKYYPEAIFLIIGVGVQRANLEQKAKGLGLDKAVIFMGERRDIPELLAAMDIFVLASVREALPMVVLEAMAMNKPVVAYNVGSVAELVIDERTGIILPKRDHRLLAHAVCRLLQDDCRLKKEMAKRARRRVREFFDIGKISRDYLELYAALANQRR